MAGNVAGLISDPDFQKLAPADQRTALMGVSGDKMFGQLDDAGTMKFVQGLQARSQANTPPSYVPRPSIPASMNNDRDIFGEVSPFNSRVGERIKQNVSLPAKVLDSLSPNAQTNAPARAALQQATGGREGTQQMLYGTTKPSTYDKIVNPITSGYRLIGNMVKGYVQDPATAVGDLVTASPELSELGIRRPTTLGKVPQPTASTLSEVPTAERRIPIMERPDLTPEQKVGYVKNIDQANAQLAKQQRAAAVVKNQRNLAELIQNDVRNTHDQVRGALNQRWEDVRAKTANIEVPTQPIEDAIEKSKQMLAGTPADLQIFKQITSYADKSALTPLGEAAADAGVGTTITPEEYAQRTSEAAPGQRTIPFNDARTQFTALGDQWMNADGNLKRALRNVYDAYNQQLREGAGRAGIGPEYDQLSKDWHQYMTDWRGRGLGAPLAKVLNAPHPDFVPQIINGKGGQLLIDQYGRYANPQAIRELQRITREGKLPPPPAIPPPPAQSEPAVAKPGPILAHTSRIAGKIIGGTVGSALGHPLIGYSAGGEAGAELARRIAARRTPPTPPAYTRSVIAQAMEDAKNGVISPGEADRRITRAGGKVKVKPIPTPP